MRQGQQNRRGRGRNRKSGGHHNPLTRSYESNGPDVKIRGTPAHIAEKYISLARDALSSGDPVLAENYLQHAEHYNRIIMGVREQQVQNGEGMNGGMGRNRPFGTGTEALDGDDFDDDGEDDDAQLSMGRGMEGQGGQPRGFDQPQQQHRHDDRPQRMDRQERQHRQHDGNRPHRDQFGRHDRQDRFDRGDRDRGQDRDRGPDRGDRQDRSERHDRSERPERMDRAERQERTDRNERPERVERQDRPDRNEPGDRVERQEPAERHERPARVADVGAGDQPPVRGEQGGRRRERFADQSDQPEFLRRPVRRPRREASDAGAADATPAADANPADKTTA